MMKIMLLWRYLFASCMVCVLLLEANLTSAITKDTLPEDAVAGLIKPSVVRIIEHVTGAARIAAVTVDMRKQTIETIPNRFTEAPVDEYFSGSGFIIHPDGYIATNAHVVSLQTVKVTLAEESAFSAVYEGAMSLTEEEVPELFDSDTSSQFSRDIIQYIIDHSEFQLKQEIVVLRPGSQETSVRNLMKSGFPAQVIALNENFLKDERDAALLKIEEHNLPAISLGTSDLTVGSKVFIFGFPATAEINEKDPLEATFTEGVVSALKRTRNDQLTIYQTDAKVSQGSSGGPLFTQDGQIRGLITFQTTGWRRAAGDNFAFALPVSLITELALAYKILPTEGTFGQSFRAGLAALQDRHCDRALRYFEQARQTNSLFPVETSLAPWINQCHIWQAGGQTQDSYWQELRKEIDVIGNPFWILIVAVLALFSLLGGILWRLTSELRHEEQEVQILEQRLLADEKELRRYEEGQTKKTSSLIRLLSSRSRKNKQPT